MKQLILLLVMSWALMGQSAYYRLGYGDLYPSNDPLESSLGTGIIAFKDSTRITTHNPASLNGMNRVYFNVALGSEFRSVESTTSNNTRLEKVNFATPLSKKVGMSLGMMALTDFRTDYAVSVPDGDLSETSRGGIWDYQLGLGYAPGTKLSLGLKLHVLHGFLRRQSTITNELSSEMYVLRGSIDGKSLELGALSHFGDKVTLGLTADIPFDRPLLTGEDSLAGSDNYVEIEEELAAWPAIIKLGLVYNHSKYTKFLSGISQLLFPEAGFENEKIFALPAGWHTVPVASFQIAMLRLPLDGTSRNWTRRTGWQLGLSVKNYYLVSGSDVFIYEYALLSGVNLGLRNSRSVFDISGEFGSRGGESSLPSELFARIKFGIQVNDIWFKKAKRR